MQGDPRAGRGDPRENLRGRRRLIRRRRDVCVTVPAGREAGRPPVPLHPHPGARAMRLPNVTIYGSRQCGDTNRVTQHLDAKQVPYEFKDVDESPEYNDYIAGLNGGKRVMPTIRINNETYFNPSIAQVDEILAGESPAE